MTQPRQGEVILAAIRRSAPFRGLLERLPARGADQRIGGCVGSSGAAALAALHESHLSRVFVAVASDPQNAQAIEADLESLLGEGRTVTFPQRESLPYESAEPHLEVSGLRVEAVEALFTGESRILVTTLRALQERAPVPDRLEDLRLEFREGDEPGFASLITRLEERGFDRVPLVESVGQFSVRGGLLDVFSFGNRDPLRIEFWDEEISSIRSFDILNQRTTGHAEVARILPVDFTSASGDPTPTAERSLLELLPPDTLIVDLSNQEWEPELAATWRHVVKFHDGLVESGASPLAPSTLFMRPQAALEAIASFPRLRLLATSIPARDLPVSEPPKVDRDMKQLASILEAGERDSIRTLILCDNQGQVDRLAEILGSDRPLPEGTELAVGSLAHGFVVESEGETLRVLTDHEVFRRTRRIRRGRRFRGGVALESLSQLTSGDYVVHLEHGIGIFRGLKHIRIGGEDIESMAIEYENGELLRVPVYRLDLVERWVGETEDAHPKTLHKIGGKRWRTLRKKTEETIERMTAELLRLYADRRLAHGFSFSPDTRWQKEMESSFLYEDTPDQRRATEDVKRDMESAGPMDRLICGDVGYGKTEVGIRAAFKAVQDGKQVAILAPTTILVEQHKRSFEERLADFPVNIGVLSRFRSPKQQTEVLKSIKDGSVDIAIGTHRLLSPDVSFKDLGLVIVDEEQRFGVRHKERLKQLKTSVDVLTLTATPIPRTLYLSLTGLRDLSRIETPPRDRMPIITHVLQWSDQILAEALQREFDRGGQAFFLHNRVETIESAAERVHDLAPGARIDVAHGQMTGSELDRVMHRFVNHETDILVCTSIIENGLDVPNANTLIVNRADRFGLAQLYQIRGRVGRADRRAYCYLLAPGRITDEAEQRLKILEHYTELGSGYSVAVRDLELRGTGNLLGGDQSGFATAVGLDAYMRLVEQTVRRLQETQESGESYPDPDLSLPGSAFLPDGYVSDSSQKLHLYRRLSKVSLPSEVEALREELADRFGTVPDEVARLLDGATLRVLGRRLGVERILVRDREARINFRPGVIPRLNELQGPLTTGRIDVEVRRMTPLSLALKQVGTEPFVSLLIRALEVLSA